MSTNQALQGLVDIVLEKARNAPADEAIRARGDLHAAIDACLLAEREACAREAKHWQRVSRPEHQCGAYIAAAILSRRGGKS
jgi:hypothetical protein